MRPRFALTASTSCEVEAVVVGVTGLILPSLHSLLTGCSSSSLFWGGRDRYRSANAWMFRNEEVD